MTDPVQLTLTLPLPPNLANARMHWRVKNRAKLDYYAACDARQALGLIPPPPRSPLPRARITAVAHVVKRMDAGNLMHRVEKWPCDWLVTRGYLVDDGPQCLEWSGLPKQYVAKRGSTRIEIVLDNLASAH